MAAGVTVDNINIQVTASATSAAKSIDKVTAALGRLRESGAVSSLEKINGTFNKVANNSQTLQKNITSLNKIGNSYNKTLSGIAGNSGSWGKRMFQSAMNVRASFLLIRGAISTVRNIFEETFNESAAYIENLNLFAVSMGDKFKEAKEYAEQVQSALGIDASAWMGYQGKFQNLITGFGVANDKAAIMSKTLTQLTYDLSSFFNVDFDTAFRKLQSGMTGQIKGLKEYGINLSVAALQEYADAHALDVKVRSLTEAERSILRYNLVMERTAKIQGDMARTIVTPANAMRIFSNQVTLAKRAIGNLLSVVIVKFIPYMQAFVRAIEWVANELAKLFGFKLPKIDYSDLGKLNSATGGVSQTMDDLGNSTSGTTKKVKELKKNLLQLMGFDEINILKAPTKDTATGGVGGAGGSGADIGGGIGGLADDIGIYDFLKNLDTTKSDKIFEKFKKIGQKVIDIVKWTIKWWDVIKFIGKLLVGIWAVAKIVKFIGKIKALWEVFKSLAIVRTLSKYWNYFLDGFAMSRQYLGKGFFSSIGGGIRNIRNSLGGVQKAGIAAVAAIAGFFSFKDLFYNLTKGTLTWQKGLLDVGIAAVAIGAAFALTGPVGGVIAILGAVAGAIYGVYKAQDELAQKTAEMTLTYQIASQRIEDAQTYLNSAKQSMDNLNQATQSYQRTLADINLANTLIQDIITLNSKTKLTVSEQNLLRTKVQQLNNLRIPGIKVEFDETKKKVKQTNEQLENMRTNMLKNAKTAALQSVLTKYYENFYTQLLNAKTAQTEYNAAQKDTKDIQNKLNIANAKYTDTIIKMGGGLAGTIAAEKAYGKEIRVLEKQLGNAKTAEKDLKNAYEKSKEAIDKSATGIKNYKKELDGLTNTSGKSFADGMGRGIAKNADSVLKDVALLGNNSISELNRVLGVKSPSRETRKSGLNFDEGMVVGINHNKRRVITASSNVGKSAISALNKSFSGVKTNNVTKAFDTVTKKASATFKSSTWNGYANNANNALNRFSVSGFVKRLSSVGDKARQAFRSSTWNSYKNSVNKINQVKFSTLTNRMNSIKSKADSLFKVSTWRNYANNISNGFKKGLKMPTLTLQIGSDTAQKLNKQQQSILKAAGINRAYMPLLYWKKDYAMGGTPVTGEIFRARENGSELVGRVGSHNAVLNNDQIVAMVAKGVYDAMVDAMSVSGGGDGGTYNINVYPQIDGRTIGEASVEYHNGQVRQKGRTPLIGVT